MNDLELSAWTLLTQWKNFWGNRWAKNYKVLVEKLLKNLQDKKANMSIHVPFLRLDKFPDNFR